MAVDGAWLFGFLEEVSRRLDHPVTLVAVGGTALTLLGVKESTLEVDFTAPADDLRAFRSALASTPHGVKVDTWPDGQVFSQFLPQDYIERSRAVRTVGKVRLRALHPVDIVVTKAGRRRPPLHRLRFRPFLCAPFRGAPAPPFHVPRPPGPPRFAGSPRLPRRPRFFPLGAGGCPPSPFSRSPAFACFGSARSASPYSRTASAFRPSIST